MGRIFSSGLIVGYFKVPSSIILFMNFGHMNVHVNLGLK